MNLGQALRGCSLIATLLLAACGSSGDDSSGLLDDDGSSSGGGSSSRYLIEIAGPDCVEPGVTATGYTATVTRPSGAVAPEVFVALSATINGTASGTIRATLPDGKTRLNGGDTNAAGVLPFSYTPPSDAIRNSLAVTITGTVQVDGVARGSEEYPIELQPTTVPTVRLQGPKNASGARQASGTVTAASGELLPDFLITVTRPASGCGTPGPISGATISVTPTLADAAVRLVDDASLIDGTAAFDYVAPTVEERTAEVLSVTASINGVTSNPATFSLAVAPPPDPAKTLVTVSGPSSGSAGRQQTGYTATVTSVAADGTRVARENTQLSITLSDGGSVTLTPDANGLVGVTDRFGQVKFAITPKTSTASNSSLTISAAAVTTGDAVLASSCALTGSVCTGTQSVAVQPDAFQFTAPVFGSAGTVGQPNAVPLAFQWATASGAGVAGCVNLSATFQGSGTSTFLLEINGDPVPAAQSRVVQLGSNGQFQVPVRVYSDRSGFVQVSATENRSCAASGTSGTLTASTGVQFVDEICETTSDGRNCVDLTAPLRTLSSPDASGAQRSVALTFSVLNSAFAPVDGAQVLFSVVSPAAPNDPNERVFPGGGTTNASGVASSLYYVPTFSPALTDADLRTVDVRACVRRNATSSDAASQVCSTRRIEIVGPPAE